MIHRACPVAEQMIEHNLDVSVTRTIEPERIDTDFFQK
ncbi:MAG: hypothetical protein ACI8V5_002463 [Limisphaerales bacterium]